MRVSPDLETRLHADAQELDRDFPGTDSLERRILARVAITARDKRRAPTRLQELALAGLLVGTVALLAIGVAQLRATTRPGPARTHSGSSMAPCTAAPLHMVNATIGWQGDPDRTDWYGFPLRTTDGGLHWLRVPVPYGGGTKTGSTSCFLDADHAWVTGITADGLVVYSTANGGQTWKTGVPVPGALIARLAFIDAQRGWLLTDIGPAGALSERRIYSTTDGGLHWSLIVSALAKGGSTLGTLAVGCTESGMTFVDVDTGWLSWDCRPPSPPAAAVIQPGTPAPLGPLVASTRDGGRSWQRVALPTYSSSGQWVCSAYPPVVALAQGVLPVTCQGAGHSALFITDDGGRHWSFLRPPTDSDRALEDFIDADTGWAVSPAPGGNDLYRTINGGRDWVLVKRGLFRDQAVTAFQFADASVGFVYTMAKDGLLQLLKTTDGGITWTALPTGPTNR
jgi:photosystem II stability/assembly factor-like uncharacterized protein